MTVDWPNKIIDIPKTDLTLISGTLYELDTEWFKDEIRILEADIPGMPFLRIIDHNTSYTVVGVTYARKVEVINGYKVRFEDGQYSVRLVGSNNNLFDVENGVLYQNQVQIISGNSAGLIVKSIGSGLSTEEHDKLMGLPEETEITADIDANSTELAAIRAKTDNLPVDPAGVSDIPTETEVADAVWNKELP